MTFPTGSANPYDAPAVDLSPVSLAEDTEFLFNDKVVAGIGKISLPRICVITGERTDLTERSTPFYWCSRWFTIPRNVLIGMAIILLVQPMQWGPRPLPGTGAANYFYTIPLVIGAGSVIGAVGLAIAGRLTRQTIHVDWYTASRIFRRVRAIWFVGTASILGGIVLLSSMAAQGSSFGSFSLVLAMGFGGLTHAFANASGYQPLRLHGRYNGLFLIGGFREPFLKEVQRLAALRSSRESRTVTKPD